ncbi:recombinase RecT [Spiroplasma endosymbiont of Amphimallon solstitiale]|uniref:recombinase RecT n=1 Tax=Spiroplasma endosymbiont of Amphimallon solstitiale TaxID=3066288 RepID=UPI00313BBCDD
MYSWFTIINGFCYFTNRKSITFIFFYCYYWFNSQILIHCANSFLFLIIELTQFNFYISVLFNFTIQELKNGYEKYLYMSKEEIENHFNTYSETYKKNKKFIVSSFEAMALKTVLTQIGSYKSKKFNGKIYLWNN